MKVNILYLLLVWAVICSSAGAAVEFKQCIEEYCANSLSFLPQFEKLSSKISIGPTTLKVVKIVYHRDRIGDGEIYFVNTNKFSYHQDFVTGFLGKRIGLDKFNQNYLGGGRERDYNLGSLVHWGGNLFLLELWNGDYLMPKYLSELISIISRNFKIDGGRLLYHPLSIQQELALEKGDNQIEYITNTKLYKDMSYIPLNKGVAYGYLRFVGEDGGAEEDDCLDRTTIAVFDKIPNDIGLLGGVITEEYQTPLGHINMLSMNRGTANMSLKDAKKVLLRYRGKPVKLEVKGDKYEITELSSSMADELIGRFWAQAKPRYDFTPESIIDPKLNQKFVDLSTVFSKLPDKIAHQQLVRKIGAKASNLAVLYKISQNQELSIPHFLVPKGYGVPFNFFDQFMHNKQTGLDIARPKKLTTPDELINEVLNEYDMLNPSRIKSICKLRKPLKRIRNIIKRAEVPSSMLDQFKKVLFDDPLSPIHQDKISKLRLRSSTNSEDMEGFSGAGLYNSQGLWPYGEDSGVRTKKKKLSWKKIEKKLRKKITKIYAGLWNDRAFEEREWYSINGKKHLKIKVGILLHRAFPYLGLDNAVGEVVNGVSITADIYDNNSRHSMYINSQHYDLSVTNPPGHDDLEKYNEDPAIPYSTEEIVVTTALADLNKADDPKYWPQWSYDILSRSSIKNKTPVLKDNPEDFSPTGVVEIRRLARIFKDINVIMSKIYEKNPYEFVSDIEWKLVGSKRELWIKQVRPFQN